MKELKIIEVKSEIGAGTRGASLGVEAIKIASLDMNSDFFKQYESVEVENVNELLFDGAKHSYAKFIDGVMIMEERVCLEVYETIWEENFPLIIAGDHCTAYGTIAGIKKGRSQKFGWALSGLMRMLTSIHLLQRLLATCTAWRFRWRVVLITWNAK